MQRRGLQRGTSGLPSTPASTTDAMGHRNHSSAYSGPGSISFFRGLISGPDRGRRDHWGARRRWWRDREKNRRRYRRRITAEKQTAPLNRSAAHQRFYRQSKIDDRSLLHRGNRLHTKTTFHRGQKLHRTLPRP